MKPRSDCQFNRSFSYNFSPEYTADVVGIWRSSQKQSTNCRGNQGRTSGQILIGFTGEKVMAIARGQGRWQMHRRDGHGQTPRFHGVNGEERNSNRCGMLCETTNIACRLFPRECNCATAIETPRPQRVTSKKRIISPFRENPRLLPCVQRQN